MDEMNITEGVVEEVAGDVMNNVTTEHFDATANGKGKLLLGLGAVALAGGMLLLRLNRSKLDEMRIRALEKKGYVVSKPADVNEGDVVDAEYVEEDVE